MKKTKNSTAKRMKLRDLASVSLIFYFIDKLSGCIYSALKNSFLGFIFTSYSQEQNAFDNSFLKAHFSEGFLSKKIFRNIRRILSKGFESSYTLNKISQATKSWVTMPLRTLGTSLFAFGIYAVIIYLLRLFLPVVSASDVSYAITGIIMCISAIPMLLSKDNIASAVGKSALLGTVFRDLFGYSEERFRQRTNMSKVTGNIMIFLGMALGIATLAVHPLMIIALIAFFFSVAIIFVSPEVGVIIALFLIPFLSFWEHSALLLGIFVLIITFSYAVKLIRGKRILKFEIIDFAILFFGIIILFSGAITAGGIRGAEEVFLTCVLLTGYFVAVNLMRTQLWIKRCIGAMVSSATIVAMIGIVQYALGAVSNKAWLDTNYFFDIKGRVVSVFDNPNILSVYLVMILPFALYMMISATARRAKLLGAISVGSVMLCIVLTWSRGAWIAAILSVMLFLLIYSKKTFRYIIFGIVSVPFISFFLPQSIIRRFTSIGNLSDSSTLYRVYTWKGSLKLIEDHFISGIGYGTNAYREMYPQYAYAGIEAAEHSHSLYLQILVGTGIIGLIAFVAVMFLFAQMNLEHIRDTKDASGRLIANSAFCSVISALIFGVFDFTWYNYRIFFLFWVIVAISCACIRVCNDEVRRHSFNVSDNKEYT